MAYLIVLGTLSPSLRVSQLRHMSHITRNIYVKMQFILSTCSVRCPSSDVSRHSAADNNSSRTVQISRDVNEASKVRGRGQIPQGRSRGQGQRKICGADAELCEAEARYAVLTINY